MVSGILNMAVRASASAGRVQEIMDEVPAQKKAVCPQREGIDGSIEFEHVSFSYAGSPREALKDISVKVEAGETIGIIGPTGSGKTTLVNMIPRFYDVTGGRMLAGGRDVKEFDEAYLRSRIAIVPQKALLFSGTIEYNLSWGKENASQEEIRWAARIACADEFVEQLPQKYETMLGQEGVNLSGGQKQRLCLARALLRNPEILILDDCTSALDANTEARVLSGLRQEVAGMTVMLISQRISTVRRADRILCMDNGQSVGFGTHEELMERCALYRDIYSSQIGGVNRMPDTQRPLPPPGKIGRRQQGMIVVKPRNMRGTLRRLWVLTKGQRQGLAWIFFFSALASCSAVLSPYLIGKTVNSIDTGSLGWLFPALLAGVYVCDWLSRFLQQFLMAAVGQRVVGHLRKEIFSAMRKLPLAFFDQSSHGDLMSRLTNDVDNISITISDSLTQLMMLGFTIVGVLGIMLSLNPFLTGVSLISVVLVFLLTKVITGHTSKLFKEQQQILGRLNGQI